ncbi:MAG: DNA sulfur modification protein DndE [Cellvibrio sp. 79]|nr:MAG: DNA sulfur modification protein DndE [Cellvibrio sp. 79]
MLIESVRLSEKAKSQLVRIKARTGIHQWNHLCRWAFCLSLREPSVPPFEDIITNSNVEMTWKTFGGEFQDVYLGLLKTRLIKDNILLNNANLQKYFKLHLHRGISYLAKKSESITHLMMLSNED